MKKLEYKEVQKYFDEHNCTLLSKEYHGVHTPLEYICECGNKSKIAFSSFKTGNRCQKCGGKKSGNKLRFDVDELKKLLKENDCTLIGEYINAQTPFEFICSCGNKTKTRLAPFKNGARCDECNIKKRVSSKQKNNNYAKQYTDIFEKEGYELLSPYVKAAQKVDLECPKGHKISMKPSNFKTGYRCGECSPSKKKTYKEVKEYIEKEKFVLLSSTYKDAFSKLKAVCPKGHEIEFTWDHFRAGLFIPK